MKKEILLLLIILDLDWNKLAKLSRYVSRGKL